MNTSMVSALNAMRSTQMRIDTIGNNIANVNTHGFKGEDVSFGSVLAEAFKDIPKDPVGTRLTPAELHVGNGSVANLGRLDFSIGAPEETGIPSDLYIDGNAFFQVLGSNNEVRYTRMGSFATNLNAQGQVLLTTANGDPVLSTQGSPIVIPNGYTMQVGGNGDIQFVNKNNKKDVQQGPQIALYTIPNRQSLNAAGDGEYTVPPNALQPALTQNANIKQGFLEQSNVDLQKEMSTLIEAQRMFQFNSRALSFVDQMDGVINNITSK
jgi:flagellar basal-body rod protein FlgG